MTNLSSEFMQEELDFLPMTENSSIMFKDYYYKICQFVKKNNAFNPSCDDIEEWLEDGFFSKAPYFKCSEKNVDQRKYWFKRAMGLQLIYDNSNGRNSIIKGTDGNFDICRECVECLEMIGLIQPIRW